MEPRHSPILVMILPPLQYAVAFLAGLGLNQLMPWRPAWMTMEGVHWVGTALALAGFIVAPASAGWFLLRGTTLHPAGQPTHLIVRGAHAWSRNPMYLSLTIIYVGMALALGKTWPLVLVVLPWAAVNWIVIPFEESRLRKAFGQDYADYCRTVRRWM
jgi:protein-S-isoprenylcysteine O-methyltransferase Ste14